jgi:hypothetical protein
MSTTQPLIADRAKTSSSRKREIGFENEKFYCQFRHLWRQLLNKTKDKLPLAFRQNWLCFQPENSPESPDPPIRVRAVSLV